MKTALGLSSWLMALWMLPTHAGTLQNKHWTASGCGSQPVAPSISVSDIETYNLSIAAINEWQQKSKTYFECVVKEADADNALIVETTNNAQTQYRETLEKLSKDAATLGQSFEQK